LEALVGFFSLPLLRDPAALGPIVFLFAGFMVRATSDITPGDMLQKLSPKLLITLGFRVGGSIEQPKQDLSGHVLPLNPLLVALILSLLQRSESTR